MNASESDPDVDDGDGRSPPEPSSIPPSKPANDQVPSFSDQAPPFRESEMPSLVVTRANMLARAGVPTDHIKRILDGHYDLWDEETVFWENQLPGKGKLAMQLLRPVYEFPVNVTSVPSDTDLAYLVRKAFLPPSPGPLPRSRGITLVRLRQLQESQRSYKWLDGYTAPGGKPPPLNKLFPWGPVRERLEESGRFQFEVYADFLPQNLRLRLWESFTTTLGNLWMHLTGTKTPMIVNPWLIRDMWTLGNCLPLGFSSGSVDSFIFLLLRR